HRGLGDRRRDAQDQARIESRRYKTVLAIMPRLATVGPGDHVGRRLMGQLRDRTRRGELHCLVNGRGGNIESAAKNVGKAKDVVDLIWKIRAPGANHGVLPRRLCDAWL